MESRKIVLMNLFAGQQWRNGNREQTYEHGQGEDPWTVPTRLLCPWDFPGKNTELNGHFLLQGIFQTQGLNPRPLHWQVDYLAVSHQGSLKRKVLTIYYD